MSDETSRASGRPSVFSQETAENICARLSDGESLLSICRDPAMPHRTTVMAWVLEDREGFSAQYARARERQAHALADGILEIADDGRNDWMEAHGDNDEGWRVNGEHLNRSRLRVDARKWLASKILPKDYGDKLETKHVGKDGESLALQINIIDVPRKGGE